MKIFRKPLVWFGFALTPSILSFGLMAQDDLLQLCFSNAQAVNSGTEILWSDLEPCDSAIEQLDQMELSDHQITSVLLNRAIILTELTEYSRARSDLEAGLRIDPQSVYLHLNIGVLSMVEQDYAAATDGFSLVLELEPNNALALFNRALAHYYSGDLVSAVDDLFTLQLEHPYDYLAWVTEESLPTLAPLMPELILPIETLDDVPLPVGEIGVEIEGLTEEPAALEVI